MKKCPVAARPILNEIRKTVKRPPSLPKPQRLKGTILRFRRMVGGRMSKCCPMGMLPYAHNGAPVGQNTLGTNEFGTDAIAAFYYWWDKLTEPQKAVDAVWGKNK